MNSIKVVGVSAGGLVNDQGELFRPEDYAFVAIPRRAKLRGWFMAFEEAMEQLSKDRELWGQPRAVLDYLFSKLSFENHILVQQADIASELGMQRADVSRAISRLCKKGVIERGPKLGRTWSYKLNPYYGWKGDVRNLYEEQKRRLQLVKDDQ